jgi:hypothetical protein
MNILANLLEEVKSFCHGSGFHEILIKENLYQIMKLQKVSVLFATHRKIS